MLTITLLDTWMFKFFKMILLCYVMFDYITKYYKVANKESLNVPGESHFADMENIWGFLNYKVFIQEITVPIDAKVTTVNPHRGSGVPLC